MGEGDNTSPQITYETFKELIYASLNNALDYGITEHDFWEMTLAEVRRAVASFIRVEKLRAQEKASFDYILANLIVKGVAITLGDKSAMPTIEEVYGDIITKQSNKATEDKINERKTELSTLRFMQFAKSFNEKFSKEESKQ